ncbi:MAG: DUF4145 domain-containing protein [Gemmatimonadaceae bacterium]
MNRELWTRPKITHHGAPPWLCPTCRKSNLRLDLKSLRSEETKESRSAHFQEEWEPEWNTYIFSAWLKCSDAKCGESVVITGLGGVEPQWSDEEGVTWEQYFVPQTMSPMPDVIDIPPKCRPEVAQELRAAFRVMWSDPAASMNRIRTAIERLMDSIGIKRRTRGKNGLVDLKLHDRIVQFQKREPELGSQLLALKYAGNTGSHGSVEDGDVIDALAIIEHVLAEVVTQRSRNIAALAAKLTKKHAPKKKGKAASSGSVSPANKAIVPVAAGSMSNQHASSASAPNTAASGTATASGST